MVRGVALLAILILTAVSVLTTAGVARAEGAVNEAAQAMAGGWEISNVDRDRRCPLVFTVEPAPGGYKVDFEPVCTGAFPILGDVVAWGFGPKDMLRLLDAKGAALMEFTEVENGMFESERGADGLLFLQTQASLKVE